MTVQIVRGDARRLPLADNTVDLVCTSPPYFALRSYTDGCATCAANSRARNRGYMERFCPVCQRVFTSGRNKCHVCNVTTLATETTKMAQQSTECPDCGGTGQGHYDGQIGSESTPQEWLAALLEVTAECVRVLKPSGSLFVNLGDKYAGVGGPNNGGSLTNAARHQVEARKIGGVYAIGVRKGAPPKSLMGLPWRYALACIDQLGLILRAEIIWAKPNGLPESVTDRVRRSHEQWFHFTLQPRYYSAVDEIREPHTYAANGAVFGGKKAIGASELVGASARRQGINTYDGLNPLGKLPGSVWTIPSEPLTVPAELGVDHFAAFPLEWPRRIIQGWCPAEVCTVCGEGRRPVHESDKYLHRPSGAAAIGKPMWNGAERHDANGHGNLRSVHRITGYVCACTPHTDQPVERPGRAYVDHALDAEQGRHGANSGGSNITVRETVKVYDFEGWTPAPTTPGVVLDPFGGTGTTALAAKALGRDAIHVDLSADYNRIARWRTTDRDQLAKAMQVTRDERARDNDLYDVDPLFEVGA